MARITPGSILLLALVLTTGRLLAPPLPEAATSKPPTRFGNPLPSRRGEHESPLNAAAFHSLDTALFTAVPEVEAQLAHYAQPAGIAYLSRVLERGQAYLPFIHTVAAELDLPWELAYLPIIESAFRHDAVSKSGAVGLWQFMQNSVDPYDLRINDWLDERRDFYKATYGALRKLETNYRILGDWLLAIGAYNCGLGCMQRAVAAAGSDDFWTLARGGFLPAETRSYVPRFLAVAHYASYPGRYGLPQFWEGVSWERISVPGPVNLHRLAEISGVPVAELHRFNSELNQPVTPPLLDSYTLKVQEGYADKIREALETSVIDLVDMDSHIIQRGDTIYALARYYGISSDLIMEFNQGLDPRRLSIGTQVRIPLMQKMPPFRETRNEYVPLTYEQSVEYEVRRGDTLSSIARRYRTSPEDLAHNNQLKLTDLLQPGLKLRVPAPGTEE